VWIGGHAPLSAALGHRGLRFFDWINPSRCSSVIDTLMVADRVSALASRGGVVFHLIPYVLPVPMLWMAGQNLVGPLVCAPISGQAATWTRRGGSR
jgi:hypothetical protein